MASGGKWLGGEGSSQTTACVQRAEELRPAWPGTTCHYGPDPKPPPWRDGQHHPTAYSCWQPRAQDLAGELGPTALKAGLVSSWEDPSQGGFLSRAPGLTRRGKAHSALCKSPTMTILDLALLESLWLTPAHPHPGGQWRPWVLAGAPTVPTPYLSVFARPAPGMALVRCEPVVNV